MKAEEIRKIADEMQSALEDHFSGIDMEEVLRLSSDYEVGFAEINRFIARLSFEESMAQIPAEMDPEDQREILRGFFVEIYHMIEANAQDTEGGEFSLTESAPTFSIRFTQRFGACPIPESGIEGMCDRLEEFGWDRDAAMNAALTAAEEFMIETLVRHRLIQLVGAEGQFVDTERIVFTLAASIKASEMLGHHLFGEDGEGCEHEL